MWKRSSRKNFESEAQAYDCALDLLTRRDYSGVGMRKKLEQKGVKTEWSQAVVKKLVSYNLLNEKRYAQRVYEAWLNKKYYGRQHLLAELQKKQVSEELIPGIMEQFTEAEETARAELAGETFRQRNLKKMREPDAKLYAAAARYMAARGFSAKYIRPVVEKLLGGLE